MLWLIQPVAAFQLLPDATNVTHLPIGKYRVMKFMEFILFHLFSNKHNGAKVVWMFQHNSLYFWLEKFFSLN